MKTLTATTMFSAAVLALAAAADVPLATSPTVAFALNTIDCPPFAVATTAEAAAFANFPLTWREGETLAIESPNGTVTAVATSAATAGSFAFAPTCGGVWKITSSEEGVEYVCVPWSVFGDGGLVCASTAANPFAVDVVQSGPNRKSRNRTCPPIAYSGDDWSERSESAASSLTVTPPADSGAAPVCDPLIGTGVLPFSFDKTGKWTVTLAMADGTTRTAVISVDGGLVVSFR